MTKKFVLVSLQEKKAKKIAEVISNNTSRKILDFLSGRKDATASDIHKELKIPLPTVDYNLKALMAAKLVKSDTYHYSEKGKEVSHYRIANQYVIIAPAEEKESLREKLKGLLPVALIAGLSASLVRTLYGWLGYGVSAKAAMGGAFEAMDADMAQAAPEMLRTASEAAKSAPMEPVMEEAANSVAEAASFAMEQSVQVEPLKPTFWQYLASHPWDIVLFFLIGIAIGVGIYYLYRYFKKRRQRFEIEV